MDTNNFKDILNRLTSLEGNYKNLSEKVSRIGIDKQYYLRSNTPITAGTSCRITYDSNGLVLRGDPIRLVDIPNLPIEHITNLQSVLDSKATKKYIDRLRDTILNSIPCKGNATHTGVKINYDDNGYVVSSSNLLPIDIPKLTIDHIEGLSEIITQLTTSPTSPLSTIDQFTHSKVSPGTYMKVTIDQYGHVIQGGSLTENDIPQSFNNKINNIESRLITLASQSSVNAINSTLVKKLDSNTPINSGVFTKVTVDRNGLVTFGDRLSINDLPSIDITNITNLSKELNNRVLREDFTLLSEQVSSISNLVARLSNPIDINNLATKEELLSLESRHNELYSKVNQITSSIPLEVLSDQLNSITSQLQSIEDRLSAIEKFLNIPDNL